MGGAAEVRAGAEVAKRGPGRPPEPGIIERRRRELVEAAYTVFARKGYAATGVADIVAELGVGRGTFYRYFDNKRDILVSVLDFGLDRMMTAVFEQDTVGFVAATDGSADVEDLLDYLRGSLERMYTIMGDDPGLARVVAFELTGVDDELTQRLFGLTDLGAKSIQGLLLRGVELGLIRDDLDTETVARIMTAAFMPALVESIRGELTPDKTRRYVDASMALLRTGVFAA
ncbi:MAG: TetR/AcrR family transcriptional regulator [Mycobacteriaceae bacterium]|nr:TetR/AcrR family transcriptional regulator [Mycobacteriaceae bacterium]